MHDPETYEDPDEFRPERLLRDGKPDPAVKDPYDFVFGFGRRCVSSCYCLWQLYISLRAESVPGDTLETPLSS